MTPNWSILHGRLLQELDCKLIGQERAKLGGVYGREPRALITPNHGAFEALPLNPLFLDTDFARV